MVLNVVVVINNFTLCYIPMKLDAAGITMPMTGFELVSEATIAVVNTNTTDLPTYTSNSIQILIVFHYILKIKEVQIKINIVLIV